MRGRIYKRCTCPPRQDPKGRRQNCRIQHGSWVFVADAGTDPDTGKRRQITRGGFTTADEAEAALAEFVTAVNAGRWSNDAGMTVSAWLADWLTMLGAGTTKASTLRGYSSHVRLYLDPHLGHLRLRDLRKMHVERMVAAIATPKPVTRGKGRGRGGRHRDAPSPATLDSIRRTLRTALSTAQDNHLIQGNPAMGRITSLPPTRKVEVQPWEPEELGRYLDHVASDRLAALFELDAFTGLRRGELCAVRWDAVDLAAGVLSVRLELLELGGRRWDCPFCPSGHQGLKFDGAGTEGLKTEASTAAVPVVAGVVGTLLAHQVAQEAEKVAWGEAYQDHGLVFCREDGTPLRPGDVTRAHRAHAVAAGLRPIRLHDLRHTAVSLLLRSGTDMTTASKIARHSSPRVTADIYAHALPSGMRSAVDALHASIPRDQCETDVSSRPESASQGPSQTDTRTV